MTDPPENVLINAPGDKLNLIEGANGPVLTCEASGEPKVQYRWFLFKSGDSASTSTESNMKRPSKVNQGGHLLDLQRPNGRSSTAHRQKGSINDTFNLDIVSSVVELVGSTTEHEGGVQVSTLDLGAISMDRSQSGQYICEASNKLGRAKQSIHMNILCK